MKIDENIRGLEIEIGDNIYENTFGEFTFSITERCNMNCVHCRESLISNSEISVAEVDTIMRFIRTYTPTYRDITISGGEPLLHSDFFGILRTVKKHGGEDVSMTSNGLLLTPEIINQIKLVGFSKFELSISLDSLVEEEHNRFRNNERAYIGSINAINLLSNMQDDVLKLGIRTSVPAYHANMEFMEAMTKYAVNRKCQKIVFSTILPAGKAKTNSGLLLSREQEETFIKNIYVLQKKYQKKGEFLVRTKDPLKFICRGYSENNSSSDEMIFDGCGAGIVALNFKYDGYVYPCALLDYKLFPFRGKNIEEITDLYKNSPFIKNMILMKLKGKCKACQYKYQCGGCRARALYYTDDIMGEDPLCFL